MELKWDESYSVYVEELNDQHKKLFAMINKFYEMMEKGESSSKVLTTTIAEMKKYALQHFTLEEKIMKLKNYPHLKSHQIRHKEFADKVIILEEKLQKGGPILPGEIAKFLKEWLTNHIRIEDKVYGNYYKSNNLL
jgi:hemerythrin-like metal-binding protein